MSYGQGLGSLQRALAAGIAEPKIDTTPLERAKQELAATEQRLSDLKSLIALYEKNPELLECLRLLHRLGI